MRADKKKNLEALRALVAEIIEKEPHEYVGFKWAALPQAEWAKRLGISDRTVRRLISEPPFTTLATATPQGVKVTLVREGEPAPMTVRHIANTMSKIFREETDGVVSRHAYGCLCGLAEKWPDGLQIEIFKTVLSEWEAFMAGVKAAIDFEGGYPLYLRYNSIPIIRRFHYVGLELYIMQVQASGKAPPASLVKYLGSWPKPKLGQIQQTKAGGLTML